MKITWTQAKRAYNGYYAEYEETGYVFGQFISCEDYGLILIVDGTAYPYLFTGDYYGQAENSP